MQKPNITYQEILKREGLKNTKHRNSILEILEQCEQPVTAETIFIKLKEMGISISISTVYRVLDALVDKEIVLKSSFAKDYKAVYELNPKEHRHHILCVGCKKTFFINDCPVENFEKKIEHKLGFDVTGHKLEIYGYCRDCRLVRGR